MFLDVCKAYNSLNRSKFLEKLGGYGLRPNLDRLLTHHCEWQWIVQKAGKSVWKPFGTERGITQGDTTSPMIFNIMVDAVVRAEMEGVCAPQEARHWMG